MNLLYEIKLYFDTLIEYGVIEKEPDFNEIEAAAERCFHKNYKDLTKYITKDLDKEKADSLKDKINKIKEIIKNDKKGK